MSQPAGATAPTQEGSFESTYELRLRRSRLRQLAEPTTLEEKVRHHWEEGEREQDSRGRISRRGATCLQDLREWVR